MRVFETNSQDNQEPIEWILLTSLEVNSLQDALEVIKFYTYRWVIEEYHKCLKTGFRIEQTQMKELNRIENLIGFVSVSSVKLLQMRDLVRINPNADAFEYVDEEDVEIIRAYYKLPYEKMTIGKFLKYIAQLGGFLSRKSDGNPGWQTLWEGWKFFTTLKEGTKLFKREKTYG